MVQRDTASFAVRPKVRGENLLEDGDEFYFTLRKIKNGPILLQKTVNTFDDGYALIEIESSDTENISPGTYIYDLVAVRKDGTRDSFIPGQRDDAYFVIKEGVKQGQ